MPDETTAETAIDWKRKATSGYVVAESMSASGG
jgi:hypothetical protein